MSKLKTIAVHIQSEVQFYSVEPLLKELEKNPYKLTILIERHDGDKDGWREVSAGTIELMKEHGFLPKYTEDYKNVRFDLCLTPYMDGLITANCYLKYDYGSINSKPVLTYIPSVMEGFHGLLCPGVDGVKFLSVYGKTFPVDNLRFLGKKRIVNHTKKKIVLFAPTYNDKYDAKENESIIKELKKNYYVIVKSHHGTNYLKKNQDKKSALQMDPDEYYDSSANLIDLMMRADVCLSGNSSTIGDALRAGVPCVAYAHDLNYFKWRDFSTTQYELYKKGYLLSCDKVCYVNDMVAKALTKEYKEKWKKVGEELFPLEYRTGTKGYLDAIEFFLNNPDAQKYVLLHDYRLDYWHDEVKKREKVIDEMDRYIKVLEYKYRKATDKYDKYSNEKLHRMADTVYKLFGKK